MKCAILGLLLYVVSCLKTSDADFDTLECLAVPAHRSVRFPCGRSIFIKLAFFSKRPLKTEEDSFSETGQVRKSPENCLDLIHLRENWPGFEKNATSSLSTMIVPPPQTSPKLSRRKRSYSAQTLCLLLNVMKRLIWLALARHTPSVGVPICSMCSAFV